MRFTDRILLRLLDATELGGILSPAVGRNLLDSAYELTDLTLGAVTLVRGRVLTLAPVVAADLPIVAQVRPPMGGPEWQLIGTWRAPPTRSADAVLDVTVVADARGVHTEVTAVTTTALTGLRAHLDAAADLDAALAAIAASTPDATRDSVAATLRARGLTTLDDVRTAFGAGREPSRVDVTLVSDATGPEVPRTFRLTVLAQILEDLGTGLQAAVQAIAMARVGLDAVADPTAQQSGTQVRQGLPALLLVPEASLDDADLPTAAGADLTTPTARRASRLTELTTRLRSSGIVPVAL